MALMKALGLVCALCGCGADYARDDGSTPSPRPRQLDSAEETTSAAPPASTDTTTNAAPPLSPTDAAEWVFDGYCGGLIGACGAVRGCMQDAAISGGACAKPNERCLFAPNSIGVQRIMACVPRGRQTWAFNGYCSGDPLVPCLPAADRPACADATVAGASCTTAGTKCARGSKSFVCLPKEGNVWVGGTSCGDATSGEIDCALAPQPLCLELGLGGKSCDQKQPACKTAGLPLQLGKVYSCIAR